MDRKRGKGRPTEANKSYTARLTPAEKIFIELLREYRINPSKAALALDSLLEIEGQKIEFLYLKVQEEEEAQQRRKAG